MRRINCIRQEHIVLFLKNRKDLEVTEMIQFRTKIYLSYLWKQIVFVWNIFIDVVGPWDVPLRRLKWDTLYVTVTWMQKIVLADYWFAFYE